MTIEASSEISANFRSKEFLQVNSPNTAQGKDVDPDIQRRVGNQNCFGHSAPVQLPYLTAERFPSADLLADGALANQYLTDSDLLLETQVERVIKPSEDAKSDSWPARYKIQMADGTHVYAERVFTLTGAGETIYPKDFDNDTLDLIDKERIEAQREGRAPGIMTYDDFANHHHGTDTPFREFAGKKVDIGGGGDSGATLIEFFLRYAKKRAFKKDVAQSGDVASLNWVGSKISNRKEYYANLGNDRYSMIAGELPDPDEKVIPGMENKKINPISGYVHQIRESHDPTKGRYRVIYKMRDGSFKEEYRDFVILATGYQKNLGELLGERENPFDDPQRSETLNGRISEDGAKLPLAVKIKDEEIYAMGPASLGRTLMEEENRATSESLLNVPPQYYMIRIAAFAPRNEAVAEMMSLNKPDKKLGRISYSKQKSEFGVAEGVSEDIKLGLHNDKVDRADLLTEVEIKARLGNLFSGFRLNGADLEKTKEIKLVFKKGEEQDSVMVSFEPSLDEENARSIVAKIQTEFIPDMAGKIVNRGRWNTLAATLPFDRKGNVKVPDIELVKLK